MLRHQVETTGDLRAAAAADIFEQFPPHEYKQGPSKARKLYSEEDRLLQAYRARHPESRLQPLDLNSFEPSPMRKFVQAQMELMQQGISHKRAYEQVLAQQQAESKDAAPQAGAYSIIKSIQAAEERRLRQALVDHREIYGLPAELYNPGRQLDDPDASDEDAFAHLGPVTRQRPWRPRSDPDLPEVDAVEASEEGEDAADTGCNGGRGRLDAAQISRDRFGPGNAARGTSSQHQSRPQNVARGGQQPPSNITARIRQQLQSHKQREQQRQSQQQQQANNSVQQE
jgi:hypothetical protein